MTIDPVLLEGVGSSALVGPRQPTPAVASTARHPAPPIVVLQEPCLTFGEVYDLYINDPTRGWSARTRNSYETCRKLAVAIIGADLPIRDFARAHCRDFIETLRFLPKNASKRFPRLSPREAAEKAREGKLDNLISSANVNAYLTDLSSFLNWAAQEEYLERNPARGLRLPDEVAKRNKRFPFSPAQLEKIFNAPLYCGCVDGDRAYFLPGTERPQNARFWIPLIALHTGMRLNEICQLDVTDLRAVDGIQCFVVSEESLIGSTDKQLKTRTSERVIPVHPNLFDFGLLEFVAKRRRAGEMKLFAEIAPGPRGIRAVAFSKWFTLFTRKAGAAQDRTCFHSFRHNFRDELRIARIDHDVALAIGGWTNGTSSKSNASENYGRGHAVNALYDAVTRLQFADVNLEHLKRSP
ncbi:tyrosine-type recombinase/integrase [Sphingobium yanoikuyae]|uniref:tyrosine-type recombinase/integrase n=1 Tax=Sphingobium yanoikuyae TaxID=13690 RepID=UPI00289D1A7B|nr:tyrosine-type recombinase/integrase [Sphingobium yanoikuyae]